MLKRRLCDLSLFGVLLLGGVMHMRACSFEGSLRRHLGSKAPYSPPSPESCQLEAPEGCLAFFATGVFRHGSRNPGKSGVSEFQDLQNKLSGLSPDAIVAEHREWISRWSTPFEARDASQLAHSGVQQHFEIGQRLRSRFPGLFERYSSATHFFGSSNKERSARSAAALGYGLFAGTGPATAGGFEPVHVVTSAEQDDQILRFFDSCPRWEQLHNRAKAEHHKAYLNGPEIAAVAQRIQRRVLGEGREGLELTAVDAVAVHEFCAFEISLWNQSSGMCSLLSEEDAVAVEFLSDIKHWYKTSHGLAINPKMACPLLATLLAELESAAAAITEEEQSNRSGNGRPHAFRSRLKRSHLLFAHGETLLPLLSLLSIAPPSPPPDPRDPARPFRTQHLIPMAANLIFVLYRCNDGFKVLALHNERAVGVPGCGGKLFCPLAELLAALRPPDRDCKFEQMCKREEEAEEALWPSGWETVFTWEGNGRNGFMTVNVLLCSLLLLLAVALLLSLVLFRAAQSEASP